MKKLFLSILCLGVICSLFLSTAVAVEEKGLKTAIVRIGGDAGVEPLNLLISPGTVVVWLNQYNISPVLVQFPDKKVTMACQSPVNFTISKDGTYVSNSIPYGGVASLCFIEKGEFTYKIDRENPRSKFDQRGDNPFRFEGKIIVR